MNVLLRLAQVADRLSPSGGSGLDGAADQQRPCREPKGEVDDARVDAALGGQAALHGPGRVTRQCVAGVKLALLHSAVGRVRECVHARMPVRLRVPRTGMDNVHVEINMYHTTLALIRNAGTSPQSRGKEGRGEVAAPGCDRGGAANAAHGRNVDTSKDSRGCVLVHQQWRPKPVRDHRMTPRRAPSSNTSPQTVVAR